MVKGHYDVTLTAAELYCFSRGPGQGMTGPSKWWDHPD